MLLIAGRIERRATAGGGRSLWERKALLCVLAPQMCQMRVK